MLSERILRLAYLTLALATLALVALGGYVRATGAGLACPDWPLCYGRAVPENILHPGVRQEVGHRYLASIVSVGTILLTAAAIRRRRVNAPLFRMSLTLLGILAVQVVLGGLTVLMRLNPFIVTAHLIAGTLFFQLLTLIGAGPARPRPPAPPVTQQVLGWYCVLIFFQLILGGFVGSSGAGLVCPGLPGCFGGADVPLIAPHIVHMLHRVIALVVIAFTLLVVRVSRMTARPDALRQLSLLVLFQVLLGIGNVYLRIPVPVAVLHLVVAELILLRAVLLYAEARGDLVFLPAETARQTGGARVGFGASRPADAVQ